MSIIVAMNFTEMWSGIFFSKQKDMHPHVSFFLIYFIFPFDASFVQLSLLFFGTKISPFMVSITIFGGLETN
jgi:hypothetical protein